MFKTRPLLAASAILGLAAVSALALSPLEGNSVVFAQSGGGGGQGGGGQGGGGDDSGGQGAGGSQSESQSQNQNQNENQNRNQNENQNQNQNRNHGTISKEDAVKLQNYACFYAENNFGGAAFCGGKGSFSEGLSTDWDNRVSSIEIAGSIKVTVCTDHGYGGTCSEFGASVSSLSANLDNAISSWKAE